MGIWKHWLFAAAAVGLLTSTWGCSALPLASTPLSECTDPLSISRGAAAMAVVELRADGKESKLYQMPIEGDMHVQDAIEKSRAKRKFRRMHVSVLRTSAEGRRHRMDCRYNPGKKRIAAEYDYALQPGDYIVIREDTSSAIDDMFSQISGPVKVFNTH